MTDLDKTTQVLHRALGNISNSIIDNYIQKNAEFRYDAGMSEKIVRTSSGHCCEWCNKIAGIYEYPNVPKDVYRRHDNCDCSVEYVSGGKRQNVWSKKIYFDTEEKLDERKKIGINNENVVKLSKGKDVTIEYEHSKYPGQGTITYDDDYNFEKHPDEVRIAKWIKDYFGGDIRLLAEAEEDGIKKPDYLWNNKFWELKSTTTEKSANSAIRKGIKQIRDNPGGIILNYENEINLQETIYVIEKRIKGSKPKDIKVDIMIVKKGKILKVIRY